jgi:hypothetical protein
VRRVHDVLEEVLATYSGMAFMRSMNALPAATPSGG